MLLLEDVHKSYANFHAVKGVSFSVNRGEIVGLLGPNGAGKTTIMRILTSYHFPSSGRVEIDGRELLAHSGEIKNKIGYLPENAPVYSELTVAEYLRFQAGARIRGKKAQKDAIQRTVAHCGLAEVYNKTISELSKGYRQRVGLAQALIHDPEILILDEPTSGLDPNQIKEIRELIRNLGKKKTIILSTHIMQEVEAVCSRVLILNKGSIVAQGDTGTIGNTFGGDIRFFVRFNTISAEQARELRALDRVSDVREQGQGYEVLMNSEHSAGEDVIFDWAVEKGVKIRELRADTLSLEDVFAELTRESPEPRQSHKSHEGDAT